MSYTGFLLYNGRHDKGIVGRLVRQIRRTLFPLFSKNSFLTLIQGSENSDIGVTSTNIICVRCKQSFRMRFRCINGSKNIHIGPSDYVEWLDDRKWAYIRMEGRTFGDVPLNIELKMEVVDSPNSAGIVIDAVRCCKLALDRGVSGALFEPASYFMKSPPIQYSDEQARQKTEAFIAGTAAE